MNVLEGLARNPQDLRLFAVGEVQVGPMRAGLRCLCFVPAPDIWKRLEHLINVCYFDLLCEMRGITAGPLKTDLLFPFPEVQNLKAFC